MGITMHGRKKTEDLLLWMEWSFNSIWSKNRKEIETASWATKCPGRLVRRVEEKSYGGGVDKGSLLEGKRRLR
jgi:hypothetical protein